MKPVDKGNAPRPYTNHKQAKKDLIGKLGSHCSYCEAYKEPQDLHVEHIYPQKPHPEKEVDWDNFLVSCNSCNSYKNKHLGNSRQQNLEMRFLWPHRENTFRAFQYHHDGYVEITSGLPSAIETAAEATRKMVGLISSPAKANSYKILGIAYDGVGKRKEVYELAEEALDTYLESPSTVKAQRVAKSAARLGYFSIWMEVFRNRPEVRREFIKSFKADTACFNPNTDPIPKGRI